MCELKPLLQRGKAGQENSTQKSFLNVKETLAFPDNCYRKYGYFSQIHITSINM